MAALPAFAIPDPLINREIAVSAKIEQLLELPEIFKGHELTRKDRRLPSGIAQIDALIGGIARGRISEITGPISSGKTTLAAAFAIATSRRGEVVGWIDGPGAFDPRSLETAGADLSRILWLSFDKKFSSMPGTFNLKERERRRDLKASELLLEAGGFGLVVIDFGAMRYPLSQSAALRLARAAERSGTAVLAIATNRMCGTFAALTLSMGKIRACFSRDAKGSPALFDGIRIEASVARNKLGVFGDRAQIFAAIDPDPLSIPENTFPFSSSKKNSFLFRPPSQQGKGLGVRSSRVRSLAARS